MLEGLERGREERGDRQGRLLRVGLSAAERREIDELMAGCRLVLEVEDLHGATPAAARAATLRAEGQNVLMLAPARLGVPALLDLVTACGPGAAEHPPLTLLADVGDGLVVEAMRSVSRADWLFSYDLGRDTLARSLQLAFERASRARAELELSGALERAWRDLAAVLSRVEEGVLFIDPQLRVERASLRASEMLGRTQRQLVGMPFTALGWLEPSRARTDLAGAGSDAATLLDLQASDGRVQRLRVRVFRLAREREGAGVRRMVVLSEGTPASPPPNDPLTARLASAVAHDLGNVLTPVLGHAEWLMSRLGEGDPAARWAGEIVRSAELAVELVRSLQAAHGRPGDSPEVCVADELVGQIGPLLKALAGSRVQLDVALGAPDARIVVRPPDLARVLLNLVANARDAISGDGSIAVMSTLGEDSEWVIEVLDTGGGIAPEHLGRVFQAGYSTKGSNGLGLAIVHSLLDEAGASVTVDSAPGRGTRIRIAWPVVRRTPGTAARD